MADSELLIRDLARGEIEKIWDIDRSEVIDRVYHLRDGHLVLEAEHYDMTGWPPGEAQQYTPLLCDCFDRGGTIVGAFDAGTIAGAVVLETKFIGISRDMLQLVMLHVGRPYRGQGLGRELFASAERKARSLGARRLYISSTPSEHTVGFYLQLGCVVAPEVDQVLYRLEPEDIHLEYSIH